MSCVASISRNHTPPIFKDPRLRFPHMYHWFNGNRHAFAESDSSARFSVIRNIGGFVKLSSDSVAYILFNCTEAVFSDMRIYRISDIAYSVSALYSRYALVEAVLRCFDKLKCLFADTSDRKRSCAVSVVSFVKRAYIYFYDVAFLKYPIL